MSEPYGGKSNLRNIPGLIGRNIAGGEGVLGNSRTGVHGQSSSATDSGVWGENTGVGYGVSSSTNSPVPVAGVWGDNRGSGYGVRGSSQTGTGVRGESQSGWAVVGEASGTANGVLGRSQTGEGVRGETASISAAAVAGVGSIAGRFIGDAEVSGDVRLTGGDCAENFEIAGLNSV